MPQTALAKLTGARSILKSAAKGAANGFEDSSPFLHHDADTPGVEFRETFLIITIANLIAIVESFMESKVCRCENSTYAIEMPPSFLASTPQ